MGDILFPVGGFLPWNWITEDPADREGERAHLRLLSNLVEAPVIDKAPGLLPIFFEEVVSAQRSYIWHFAVPMHDVTW